MISTLLSEVEMPVEVDAIGEDLDPITEMRLRTWARKNYCEPDEREGSWHPVIIEEMSQRDAELQTN